MILAYFFTSILSLSCKCTFLALTCLFSGVKLTLLGARKVYPQSEAALSDHRRLGRRCDQLPRVLEAGAISEAQVLDEPIGHSAHDFKAKKSNYFILFHVFFC